MSEFSSEFFLLTVISGTGGAIFGAALSANVEADNKEKICNAFKYATFGMLASIKYQHIYDTRFFIRHVHG